MTRRTNVLPTYLIFAFPMPPDARRLTAGCKRAGLLLLATLASAVKMATRGSMVTAGLTHVGERERRGMSV